MLYTYGTIMNFISNLAHNHSILESLNTVASHCLQDIRKIYVQMIMVFWVFKRL